MSRQQMGKGGFSLWLWSCVAVLLVECQAIGRGALKRGSGAGLVRVLEVVGVRLFCPGMFRN